MTKLLYELMQSLEASKAVSTGVGVIVMDNNPLLIVTDRTVTVQWGISAVTCVVSQDFPPDPVYLVHGPRSTDVEKALGSIHENHPCFHGFMIALEQVYRSLGLENTEYPACFATTLQSLASKAA